MKKNILSVFFFCMHIFLFTLLFLPPVFIPDHTMPNGGEYGLFLVIELWPIGSLGIGFVSGCIPGISRRVRLLSAAAGIFAALVCLWIQGTPWAAAVFGLLYTVGALAVVAAVRIGRNCFGGYRQYQEKSVRK